MNILEGILNDQYLRLYDPDEWDRVNQEYEASQCIPGYIIIGSVDGPGGTGDALCLAEDGSVWLVPFIAMTKDNAEQYASSLDELRSRTESAMFVSDATHKHFGKERHFIQPLALGGSPTDPKNSTLAHPEIHAKACSFWNKVYFEKLKEK